MGAQAMIYNTIAAAPAGMNVIKAEAHAVCSLKF